MGKTFKDFLQERKSPHINVYETQYFLFKNTINQKFWNILEHQIAVVSQLFFSLTITSSSASVLSLFPLHLFQYLLSHQLVSVLIPMYISGYK